MARLPVIINDVPDMRGLLDKYGIGVVVDDLNSSSLRQALAQLQRRDPRELSEKLAQAADVYSWNRQEAIMLAAYQHYECLGGYGATDLCRATKFL